VNRKIFLFLLTLHSSLFTFHFFVNAQDVLRGEVKVELEPIYGAYIEEQVPSLDAETGYRRALQLGANFFAAQIYGWSFYYDIGERARGIAEELELTPLGEIPWGDPGLFVTQTSAKDRVLSVWMDYRPTDAQRRRVEMWKMGNVRAAQAIGYSPLDGPATTENWLAIRDNALKDAARAAIRAMLQGSERNRPKEATGFISLETFPYFYNSSGRLAAQARFRVEIREIIPFAAY
jgi:hypothetical protein